MKTTLVFALAILLSSLPARARIGETLDEIGKRYGLGEKQTGSRLPGAEQYNFSKGKFGIEVIILGGKSVMEVFHKEEEPIISDEEIKALLKINAEDHNWALDRRSNQWQRSDGKLTAYRQPGHPDFFNIDDTNAVKQARSQSGKGKLEGF